MTSFLQREHRVTKSRGPVTTRHWISSLSKRAMKSPAFQPKPLGSKQCLSQKAKFAREGGGMEQQPSCPRRAVLPCILCLLNLMELVRVPFLTSVSNHRSRVGTGFLSPGSLYTVTSLKILLRSLTKVFHKVILGAGENEIPALHLSLDQASLPTKWSVLLGILCPCLSLLEVFSCELHGGWSEVRG